MYTISHAARLAGVSVELLRAWERRYGVVTPARTASGYRLYDDAAIERLRAMRAMVEAGWSARTAADAVIAGDAPARPAAMAASSASAPGGAPELTDRFAAAARRLDEAELARTIDDMLVRGSFEQAIVDLLLPAIARVGDEWATGQLSVAAEHAASHAVLRRLGTAFEAAGAARAVEHAVVVGLPAGSQHELGVLAFAIVARRAGLPIVYVGANLPTADWLSATVAASAAVIGAPTPADRAPARRLAEEMRRARPALIIALGGPAAPAVAGCLALSSNLTEAADQLRVALGSAG